MAHLYLSSTPGPWSPGTVVVLTGDEAHHAARVGRVMVGEQTQVTDGRGSIAKGRVESVSGSEVSVAITSSETPERSRPEVWLAQALAKGDRDEQAIQACTELGIDGIIPFSAERSVSQWRGDKVDKGVARWRKIVTEATKQAIRAHIPEVRQPLDAAGICANANDFDVVVLDPEGSTPLSGYRPSLDRPVLIVVGPEGGLSVSELQSLEGAGAIRCRLGPTILRTSSAGPSALAVVNVTLGRW